MSEKIYFQIEVTDFSLGNVNMLAIRFLDVTDKTLIHKI